MFTRQQYLNKECTFDEYYNQFVTQAVVNYVAKAIGEDRIKQSKDLHFNDIPLTKWDCLTDYIRFLCKENLLKIQGSGNRQYTYSVPDGICIAKTAAKQIRGY